MDKDVTKGEGLRSVPKVSVPNGPASPLIPMAYLLMAAAIAIGCHLLEVPQGVSGLLVGAALTRVKR